ncbi:MAG: phosphoglycerate kinase [Bacteroidales bacterium]|nr:phosphoglycerate kinase [Bacteroidales bacterium]MCF8332764.1 phosphoglycerate kinase [Bacteroidales bacterium]
MKTIDDFNLKGKRALIRVDFNVPLTENQEVSDDSRIKATIPTIKAVLDQGGSAVLMSHLGRPKGEAVDKYSLKHVLKRLSELLEQEVKFASDCVGEEAFTLSANLKAGEVLLLENLRFHKEETKGDETFSKNLARHGDVYVNDAFGTAHRAHASTAIVAKSFDEKMFGYIMKNELASLEKVLNNPKRPFTAVLGGAKVSGKIEVIDNLLEKADNVIIGGGMMFTFIKALGGKIGGSMVEDDLLETAKKAVSKAQEKNIRLQLPVDTIIADKFANDANTKVSPVDNIPEGWMGLDIGSESTQKFENILMQSKTILWNGPMGVFEMSNFEKGTVAMAESIAKATQKGAFSLVGGGDSVAAVNKYNYEDKVSRVSTGGGAMLEYVEGKMLPGIAAIEEDQA